MLIERQGVYYTKDTNKPYNGDIFVLNDDGEKVIEGYLKNGKEDGLWIYELEDYEGIFKDGKMKSSKRWKWWSRNNQIKEIEWNEKGGKKDGLYTEWDKNGQKWTEGIYKDGKQNGVWTYWYEDGQKMLKGPVKDGKANGVWTNWHRNGQKARVTTLKDDEIVGTPKEWNEDGSVKEGYYQH